MNLKKTIKKVLNEMENKKIIAPYQKFLNSELKNKFDWFHRIEIETLKYHSLGGLLYLESKAKIYVDADWAGKQWREYHYSTPFPKPDEELSFGDIVGGDLSKEIQKVCKRLFQILTGIKIKYVSYSWWDTYLVESKEDEGEEINESMKVSPRLARRLQFLDYEIESKLRSVYRPDNICSYKNADELLDVVGEAAIDSMYWNYFGNLDDNSKEWSNIYYSMVNYITTKYGEKIKEYYRSNCK